MDARSHRLELWLDAQKGIRGSQYLAMRYTDRLTDAGIEPSVGSRRDAYDCEHDGVAVRPGLTPAYG